MQSASQRSVRGFTLTELLVCLAIIGLLASMAMPLSEKMRERQKEESLRIALRDVRDALDAYKRASDEGRIEKAADASGYPPSLQILVDGVTDKRSATGAPLYFLRRIPRDPFNEDESLPAEGTWGLRSYASPAHQPKAGKNVYDIFSLSEAVGTNGQAYREW